MIPESVWSRLDLSKLRSSVKIGDLLLEPIDQEAHLISFLDLLALYCALVCILEVGWEPTHWTAHAQAIKLDSNLI